MTRIKYKEAIIICIVVALVVLFIFFAPKLFSEHYLSSKGLALNSVFQDQTLGASTTPVFVPDYIATPEPLKGIYMTSWVAGTPSLRSGLVKLIDNTELNAVVIDIKDYSGKIVFPITDPKLLAYGSQEVRVKDMQDFVESLHQKGIYVIARIAVFQDAYFVKYRPDLAVKNLAGTAVWKDHKGISWIDPGSREYWDYIVLLSREARKVGFDEINFDYIRFPSDGNMQDISYPFSSTTPKTTVMRNFFQYTHDQLAKDDGSLARTVLAKNDVGRLKISADMFGMVTTAQDDMGIGQVLEDALPYFDYVAPMVYPSHYPPTFIGFASPEAHPYDVVKYAMQSGLARSVALASSTGATVAQLRPWLQDFGLKMDYGSAEVRAQIKATNDIGLTSWILWSASNKYTTSALNAK